jgi:protocatechuate 3,4-dioxygenase beta subunit
MEKMDRRRALSALGAVSLGGLLAACGDDGDEPRAVRTTTGETATVAPRRQTPRATAELFDDAATCRVTPELTEGPFYLDVDAIRSDIREDRPGTLLDLALRVRDARSCRPIDNAVVDLWHCDALGRYSGVDSDRGTYLRGAQVTNADGIVEFRTIYPGSYPGRTAHIHAKVHLDRRTVLTTQLFFDDAFTRSIYERPPYSGAAGRDTSNADDGIFDERLVLSLSRAGGGARGVMTFDVDRA